MRSAEEQEQLALSLSAARRALNEHRKWIEKREITAFAASDEQNREIEEHSATSAANVAVSERRDPDEQQHDTDSLFQRRRNRSIHRRSGLVVLPPQGHAHSKWKTLHRTYSSKVAPHSAKQVPKQLDVSYVESNDVLIDQERDVKVADGDGTHKSAGGVATSFASGRRVFAWQTRTDEVVTDLVDVNKTEGLAKHRQILVRAKDTPDIEHEHKHQAKLTDSHVTVEKDSLSEAQLVVNRTDKSCVQSQQSDVTAVRHTEAGCYSLVDGHAAFDVPAQTGEIDSDVSPNLGPEVRSMEQSLEISAEYGLSRLEPTDSIGLVFVRPAEKRSKPLPSALTLQTSSRSDISTATALSPQLPHLNMSFVNTTSNSSSGKQDVGTDRNNTVVETDNIHTVIVKPLCESSVDQLCTDEKSSVVDHINVQQCCKAELEEATVHIHSESSTDSTVSSSVNNSAPQSLQNKLVDETSLTIDVCEEKPLSRPVVENGELREDRKLDISKLDGSKQMDGEIGGKWESDWRRRLEELNVFSHATQEKVSSQATLSKSSDELISTKLGQSELLTFDLSTLDEFFLPKSSKPDRAPPPYDRHCHSKLACHGFPCPPYGIRSSRSSETSGVRSPNAFGGSELMSLSATSSLSDASSIVDSSSVQYDDSVTLLHKAARSGNVQKLSQLIESGSDINAQDRDGRTPLMYCFWDKGTHLNCADFLIRSGCNKDLQATDESTALHGAAYVGAVALVELLLNDGANPMVKDSDGRLPIHWSVFDKSPKCLMQLLSVPGCDVNAADNSGMTPLMWAAYHDSPKNIYELLLRGADADEKDIEGKTAMHWAVHKKDAKSLKLVLKHNGTFYKDMKGRTVLHIAADMGSMPCCQLILSTRRDSVNDADKNGRTPLHWAAVRSRVDVCALLLDRGADASERDYEGLTALDYARRKNLTYVEALLTCHDAALADYIKSGSEVSLESSLFHLNSSTSVAELSPSSNTVGSSLNSVAPLQTNSVPGWRSDQTNEESKILTRGCWLTKYSEDINEPASNWFFWLDLEKGDVCWAKRPSDRHRQDSHHRAHLQEVHKELSPDVKSLLDSDAVREHKYAFWLVAGDRRLDLVAHSKSHYDCWTCGSEKFLLFGPVGVDESTAFIPLLQTESSKAWTDHSIVRSPVRAMDMVAKTLKK
ncbi:uncharacterized protein LOC134186110 isoform X2 [Corticium candelabrum]|uniref:uncharacterized protein LOC134186110 isoform X2 n=1 Tax=Corticium candelabrum TaxID=121492 RepID=UPI002E26B955|nr:uncharacterized protein LOC134186110 isoform X2 [Corticium candelabrum]